MTKEAGHSHTHSHDDCCDSSHETPEVHIEAMEKYKQLPEQIKKRVRALKNLQLNHVEIEESFYMELSHLEAKFSKIFQVVYDKRQEIISGAREPTELECQYESDSEDDELEESIDSVDDKSLEITQDLKGIPEFWLTVLQNAEPIAYNILECDLPILKHLVDIKCNLTLGEENGFILEFHFSKNEYFSNEKLTKQYFVDIKATDNCRLQYGGPEIVRTIGNEIQWYPGKSVDRVSFFNFFKPPTESLNDDISEDTESLLVNDFEVAQYLREDVIPKAVLLYTGEGLAEYSDDDEDEFSDEED